MDEQDLFEQAQPGQRPSARICLREEQLAELRKPLDEKRIERRKATGQAVDLLEVMTLLGHSSLAVTQIYSQRVLNDPEDPGGTDAAEFLLPKGPERRPVTRWCRAADRREIGTACWSRRDQIGRAHV
jgi:hypothetical protein